MARDDLIVHVVTTRAARMRAWPLLLLGILAGHAYGQSVDVHGYIDFRAVAGNDKEQSWIDGGMGKERFGGDASAHHASGALKVSFQLAPEWLASTQWQYQPDARHRFGLLDASLRFRPVSTTPWRWSARVGVFFPPISLENDNVGWTSPWTLSPSAINTWVGEELRTVGAEMRVEHRGQAQTLELFGAVFGKNDPAGELLAARGWALGDATSGFNATLREPDVYASIIGTTAPVLYRPFVEIDNRIGWYAGASWNAPAFGKVSLLRYDNRADPSLYKEYAGRDVFAWHTRFWSLGMQSDAGEFALRGQAMHGYTAIQPEQGLLLDTEFNAAYVLVAWTHGHWQPALRFDVFQSRQSPEPAAALHSEHGNAATLAVNWRPQDNLRITGEWMRVDSSRNQRLLAGLLPHQIDNTLQLSVRLQF
ncbi:MAG: hypothetical protein JWL98_1739 [Xanthomonadaceae bacterium]|nr:hypothetical protein [Xanthomonadaceae bacterium]